MSRACVNLCILVYTCTPCFPLFPYTTLFRSTVVPVRRNGVGGNAQRKQHAARELCRYRVSGTAWPFRSRRSSDVMFDKSLSRLDVSRWRELAQTRAYVHGMRAPSAPDTHVRRYRRSRASVRRRRDRTRKQHNARELCRYRVTATAWPHGWVLLGAVMFDKSLSRLD